MDRIHRAVELDGPIPGHIQLVVVRKVGGSSSVTHDATADDFVQGPYNQTFRETHHAKGIPSLWSLDFGERVTSNLPINPNTDVIQHDYHQATFQHKPMQKSDLRMDCNVMMQNEIENVNIRFLLQSLTTLFSCCTYQVVENPHLDWFLVNLGFAK